MNRHERRAAEAQTRKGFEDYAALYRQAFKRAGDRAIGEAYMRGAAADAAGIAGTFIHLAGTPAPPREECDLELSAAYGEQRFVAFARSSDLKGIVANWPIVIEQIGKIIDQPIDDVRHETRQFIVEMIIDNRQYDHGMHGALIASAIMWLASSGPAGFAIGEFYKRVHYEIIERGLVNGRRLQNFRLVLS